MRKASPRLETETKSSSRMRSPRACSRHSPTTRYTSSTTSKPCSCSSVWMPLRLTYTSPSCPWSNSIRCTSTWVLANVGRPVTSSRWTLVSRSTSVMVSSR